MSQALPRQSLLPYLSLFILALFLSGGGFWCYRTYQQQLYTELDRRLQITAGHIDNLLAAMPREKATVRLCQQLPGLATITDDGIVLSLYQPAGQLICSNRPDSASQRLAPPPAATEPTPHFHLDTSSGDMSRRLIQPLASSTEPQLFLSVQSNMEPFNQRLKTLIVVLLLGGIAVLIVFALIQRRLISRNIMTIRRLARTMDRIKNDPEPPEFKVLPQAGPDARQLAKSYNALMARMADNMKRSRQFAANVTHELRTPLTILRGETELAIRSSHEPEELRQVLESNLEEISRMSSLIEDLLLLSKSDLGEIPLKMEQTLLNELVAELHHQARILAKSKQVSVKLELPEESIVLCADSLRLRQVLLNLLNNAIKYTPVGGLVEVTLRQEDKLATIQVKDNGIGIAGEHLDKIFNRFYRVDKTHNSHDGGSGLGLAIVKWIVETHGGTISVHSIAERGSIFTVTLPLEQDS